MFIFPCSAVSSYCGIKALRSSVKGAPAGYIWNVYLVFELQFVSEGAAGVTSFIQEHRLWDNDLRWETKG